LVVEPVTLIGETIRLVVKLSRALHPSLPPEAFVPPTILIKKFAIAVLESIELTAFVAATLLVVLYHKFPLQATMGSLEGSLRLAHCQVMQGMGTLQTLA
jgi:hypothetical protein